MYEIYTYYRDYRGKIPYVVDNKIFEADVVLDGDFNRIKITRDGDVKVYVVRGCFSCFEEVSDVLMKVVMCDPLVKEWLTDNNSSINRQGKVIEECRIYNVLGGKDGW